MECSLSPRQKMLSCSWERASTEQLWGWQNPDNHKHRLAGWLTCILMPNNQAPTALKVRNTMPSKLSNAIHHLTLHGPLGQWPSHQKSGIAEKGRESGEDKRERERKKVKILGHKLLGANHCIISYTVCNSKHLTSFPFNFNGRCKVQESYKLLKFYYVRQMKRVGFTAYLVFRFLSSFCLVLLTTSEPDVPRGVLRHEAMRNQEHIYFRSVFTHALTLQFFLYHYTTNRWGLSRASSFTKRKRSLPRMPIIPAGYRGKAPTTQQVRPHCTSLGRTVPPERLLETMAAASQITAAVLRHNPTKDIERHSRCVKTEGWIMFECMWLHKGRCPSSRPGLSPTPASSFWKAMPAVPTGQSPSMLNTGENVQEKFLFQEWIG